MKLTRWGTFHVATWKVRVVSGVPVSVKVRKDWIVWFTSLQVMVTGCVGRPSSSME